MALQDIEIEHVRNIETCQLKLDPAVNLISGPNASGKTSLLEAISLATQGRSFRTPRIDELKQHNQARMMVVAHFRHGSQKTTIGVVREARKTRVKINGKHISGTSEMQELLSLHVITPESHELLEKGPKLRRQYLDWGVFHVKHSYLDCWQRYHRVLRQRNSSLRRKESTRQVQAWNKPLADEAIRLHEYRLEYIENLRPELMHFGRALLDCEPEFDYQPGWDTTNGDFLEQLEAFIEQDAERGYTRLGPHRADLAMKYQGKPVKSVFSRGQQKLLVCAMTLAQVRQLGHPGLLLVDDLPAELDTVRR
jgi:DNA replication and repair protein RecF